MTSPLASFSGIASGIDSESLISSMVSAAKTPINRLQTQKSEFTSQSRKLSDIKTKLTALQTAAKALDSKNEALGNKVSSSDEKVLKAQAVGGAAMGSFNLEVTSVAQSERTYSESFSSESEAGLFGTGTLTIQVGSDTAVDIEVTASDTLSSLASKINASGAEVSAGLFKSGSGYRLQVTGRQTGAENAISFGESAGLTVGLSDPANEKQAAQDAVVIVDDLEVTSASNTITGAVPGVTLTVVDEGSSVVQIDRDEEGLKTKLNAFVTAYNDVMKALNTEFSYSGVTKGRDSLMGDGTLHSLQAKLRALASDEVDNGSSSLTTLASIGLTTARDGTLSLDDTKFKKAVGADYEGIASALAGRSDGSGLMSQLSEGLDIYTRADGTLRTKIDNISTRNRRIDDQISKMQVRLDKYEETLRAQYTTLEQTMSELQSQSNALTSIMSSV